MTQCTQTSELHDLFMQEIRGRYSFPHGQGDNVIKSAEEEAKPYIDYIENGNGGAEVPRFSIPVVMRNEQYKFLRKIETLLTAEQLERWHLLHRLGR